MHVAPCHVWHCMPNEPEPSKTPQQEPPKSAGPDPAELAAKLEEAQKRVAEMQARMEELAKNQPQAPQKEPEAPPDPAIERLAEAVIRKLAPSLNALHGQVVSQRSWVANRELREAAARRGVQEDVVRETEAMMAEYEKGGRPLEPDVALAQILGVREMKRLEAAAAEARKRRGLNGGLDLMSFQPGGYTPGPQENPNAVPPLPANASIQEILTHGRKHFRS